MIARAGALSDSLVQLRNNPLRTLLTLLGVVFGVGSVVAMVSIGEGAQRQILGAIEAMGATSLHVRGTQAKDQNLADLVNVSVGLSEADAAALASVLGSSGAVSYRAAYVPKVSTLPGAASETTVHGVTASFFETLHLAMAEGRRLQLADERDAAPRAVLGSAVAKAAFPGGAVGQWIRIDYTWFQIVGVLAGREEPAGEAGNAALGLDRSVLVSYPALRELLEPPRTYGDLEEISIRMASIEATLPAKYVAERVLKSLHGGAEDYEVVSPEEILRQREAAQRTLSGVLIAIAAISLLVGGIGVMNIMLANVSERVTEIGLRRAVGATRRDVREQFLLEAVVICVVGGAIGAVLGLSAALVAAVVMGTPAVLAWQALASAFAISVLVGVASGYMPAARAADLNPIEALRGE